MKKSKQKERPHNPEKISDIFFWVTIGFITAAVITLVIMWLLAWRRGMVEAYFYEFFYVTEFCNNDIYCGGNHGPWHGRGYGEGVKRLSAFSIFFMLIAGLSSFVSFMSRPNVRVVVLGVTTMLLLFFFMARLALLMD